MCQLALVITSLRQFVTAGALQTDGDFHIDNPELNVS